MLRRSRYNHWTCSKLANLIRGTKKPYALDWEEWDDWHNKAQNKHPVRYWLAEKGLKKLQDFVMFPGDLYYTIKIYIQNRWIDQTHVLKTGLKPGEYYEFDYKVLYGLFNELSDYVEIELAAVSKIASKLEDCVKSKRYKFVNGRSREAGLDYLNWASSLIYNEDYGTLKGDKHYGEITPQALSAQKIKELYLWWKDIRPNRSDFDELCKSKEYKKIEEQYDKEDTKKLIELIKIRREIWS
jgi:hypothetical protein